MIMNSDLAGLRQSKLADIQFATVAMVSCKSFIFPSKVVGVNEIKSCVSSAYR